MVRVFLCGIRFHPVVYGYSPWSFRVFEEFEGLGPRIYGIMFTKSDRQWPNFSVSQASPDFIKQCDVHFRVLARCLHL